MENVLFLLLIANFCFGVTDAVLCYQCADSTDNDGMSSCQTDLDGMSSAGGATLTTSRIGPRYVKNCSLYEKTPYCLIEEIKQRGGVVFFRRDCSDGDTFAFPLRDVPSLRYVLPDNQTSCSYQNQGNTLCVSVCDADFCNGPTAGAISIYLYIWLRLTILIATFVIYI